LIGHFLLQADFRIRLANKVFASVGRGANAKNKGVALVRGNLLLTFLDILLLSAKSLNCFMN
jgi:hypothetical protein